MHTSQTSGAAPDVETPAAAAAGLNLLGDQNSGGCCGGSACAMPAE